MKNVNIKQELPLKSYVYQDSLVLTKPKKKTPEIDLFCFVFKSEWKQNFKMLMK